ncbi:hypothetical protein F5887DRAFT_286337 [Amanita rubescens]|nr:hypothetical protein F5887DRAFT_286337 [Amanita rubescens]
MTLMCPELVLTRAAENGDILIVSSRDGIALQSSCSVLDIMAVKSIYGVLGVSLARCSLGGLLFLVHQTWISWRKFGSSVERQTNIHGQISMRCQGCEGVKRFSTYLRRIKQAYESVGPETCDLLDKLLTCNPRERITAAQALDHEYFWTDPLPADPKTLPSYEASHEFDKRGHRSQHPPPGPPIPPHGPPHPVPPPHGPHGHPPHGPHGPPPHHHHHHPHPPPPHHMPPGSYRPPPVPGRTSRRRSTTPLSTRSRPPTSNSASRVRRRTTRRGERSTKTSCIAAGWRRRRRTVTAPAVAFTA